ncbi:MAG: type VI secretion system baseplate subunit TssE [Rubrivivax sp.]
MSTFTRASHIPLFDRLCAQESTPGPVRLQHGADLRASIACDLERLLNTRNGLTIEEALAGEACVLAYGVPDVLVQGARDEGAQQVLAAAVQRAIAQFEPRLREVAVQALADGSCPDRVRLVISAAVVVERQMQRVDFDFVLDAAGTPRMPIA